MESLKLVSVRHVLESLTDEELLFLINNLDDVTFGKFVKFTNNEYNKRTLDIYILRFVGFNMNFNQHVKHIVEMYRGDYSKVCRHDPVLIIAHKLLSKKYNPHTEKENIKNPDADGTFEIECYRMKPFTTYKIYDDNLWRGEHWYTIFEQIELKQSESLFITIPERPNTLFYEIEKYAQEHNLQLDLRNIAKYPTTGPYRILD